MQTRSPYSRRGMSRRDFARRAVLAAGAAAAVPGWLAAEEPPAAAAPPSLPPDLQAEAEARIAAILRRWGDRLTPEQQAEIRRLVPAGMAGLPAFRAFRLGNADEPATVLRPRRGED